MNTPWSLTGPKSLVLFTTCADCIFDPYIVSTKFPDNPDGLYVAYYSSGNPRAF